MSKSLKIYGALLIILFGFIALVEFSAEKPINWAKTFNEKDKIPFGTYVINDQLKTLFPDSEITYIRRSAYEYLDELYDYDTNEYSITGTYLHIDEYANIDEVSGQELTTYASKGNTVFIASSNYPESLLDSLNITTTTNYNLKGNSSVQLSNPNFKSDSITIERGLNNTFFKTFNTDSTTVLGQQRFGDSLYTNFIKVKYYDGEVILHIQPTVFTNYSLLKNDANATYIENVLGYLPNENILYKSKNKIGGDLSNSKLRFIFSKPALRYAWYLGLVTLLLFLVFNAKRKQRIIKEIKPLENSTIAFTKTIGNLYYETKDHNNLIDKKITYYLEYLRRVYYLDTQTLDDKFIKTLALKADKDKSDIKKLVDKIAVLRANPNCSEQDLLDLNILIEDFYKK